MRASPALEAERQVVLLMNLVMVVVSDYRPRDSWHAGRGAAQAKVLEKC